VKYSHNEVSKRILESISNNTGIVKDICDIIIKYVIDTFNSEDFINKCHSDIAYRNFQPGMTSCGTCGPCEDCKVIPLKKMNTKLMLVLEQVLVDIYKLQYNPNAVIKTQRLVSLDSFMVHILVNQYHELRSNTIKNAEDVSDEQRQVNHFYMLLTCKSDHDKHTA
jgi:hypothetical protein